MRNAGLDEAEAGIKIVRRNVSNFWCAEDTTLMAESKEELKSLVIEVIVEREKAGLKLSIQKTKNIGMKAKSNMNIEVYRCLPCFSFYKFHIFNIKKI